MPVEVQGSLDFYGMIADGRMEVDGDLTFKVNAFYYDIIGTKGKYLGSVCNSVTDNITNYVYLDGYANLRINTTGYPISGSYIKLGKVIAVSGYISRIVDERTFLVAAIDAAGFVAASRTITAGAGLTGGGDLSADRTINIVANADGSISVNPDDIQVGILATDTQHGSRGGGTLHSNATTISAGFMSTTDKIALDNIAAGNITVTVPVRNETGHNLEKGRAIAVVGWNSGLGVKLVDYADKDTPDLRPAIAILQDTIPTSTTAYATVQGKVAGLDTSMWALTDQLVLGNDGYLVRPPPDNSPFTGEVQNLASTARIDASDGHIIVALDGLTPVTADQIFALEGTNGTPSPTNHYVTDSDPRNTNDRYPTAHASSHLAGGTDAFTPKDYGSSATDPSSPAPANGDRYFNSVINEDMRYDGTRSKWLSDKSFTFTAGRMGDTASGSFYRGIDGLTFGTNIGYAVPKGTLVSLSWSRTDSDAAVLEVISDTTSIATLLSTSAGVTSDWTVNADFDQSLLKFKNQIGGNTTTDVQIVAIIRRRI